MATNSFETVSKTTCYLAFQSNFDRLVNAVRKDVSVVARKAFGKQLISETNLLDATNSAVGEDDRATKLLLQILGKVNERDDHYYTFVSILEEEPVLKDLADELSGKIVSKQDNSRPVIEGSTISDVEAKFRSVNLDKIIATFAKLVKTVACKLSEKDIDMAGFNLTLSTLFKQSSSRILEAESIIEKFTAITFNGLWDFRNYGKLKTIVEEYGKGDLELNKEMESFEKAEQHFSATEKITSFICYCEGTEKILDECFPQSRYEEYAHKLQFILKRVFTTETLEYVHNIWRELSKIFVLPPFSAFLDSIRGGSIVIIWRITAESATKIRENIMIAEAIAFFRDQRITQVIIDDECIYNEEKAQSKVNPDFKNVPVGYLSKEASIGIANMGVEQRVLTVFSNYEDYIRRLIKDRLTSFLEKQTFLLEDQKVATLDDKIDENQRINNLMKIIENQIPSRCDVFDDVLQCLCQIGCSEHSLQDIMKEVNQVKSEVQERSHHDSFESTSTDTNPHNLSSSGASSLEWKSPPPPHRSRSSSAGDIRKLNTSPSHKAAPQSSRPLSASAQLNYGSAYKSPTKPQPASRARSGNKKTTSSNLSPKHVSTPIQATDNLGHLDIPIMVVHTKVPPSHSLPQDLVESPFLRRKADAECNNSPLGLGSPIIDHRSTIEPDVVTILVDSEEEQLLNEVKKSASYEVVQKCKAVTEYYQNIIKELEKKMTEQLEHDLEDKCMEIKPKDDTLREQEQKIQHEAELYLKELKAHYTKEKKNLEEEIDRFQSQLSVVYKCNETVQYIQANINTYDTESLNLLQQLADVLQKLKLWKMLEQDIKDLLVDEDFPKIRRFVIQTIDRIRHSHLSSDVSPCYHHHEQPMKPSEHLNTFHQNEIRALRKELEAELKVQRQEIDTYKQELSAEEQKKEQLKSIIKEKDVQIQEKDKVLQEQRQQYQELEQELITLRKKCEGEKLELFNEVDKLRILLSQREKESSTKQDENQKQFPGIIFANTSTKQLVGKTGAIIRGEGIELFVPEGAVSSTEQIEISLQGCLRGPFHLPEGYTLASPVFLISPPYSFQKELFLTIKHFACLDTEQDCDDIVFFSSPTQPSICDGVPYWHFHQYGKTKFQTNCQFGTVHLKHFCFGAFAWRGRKNWYCICLYQPVVINTNPCHAIFSVTLHHEVYTENLQQFLEQNFECERFRPTLDTIPSNMLDTVVGLAVPTPQEGYKITPDIEPCEIPKERIDYPIKNKKRAMNDTAGYPPRIILTVDFQRDVSPLKCPLEVKGIQKKMNFNLVINPAAGYNSYSSESSIKSNQGGKSGADVGTLGEKDHCEIANYLSPMDFSQIISLGLALGLYYPNLKRMQTMPHDMVAAWIRGDDSTLEKGAPTWEGLVNALKEIKHRGIASKIEEEKLKHTLSCT